MNPMNEKEAVNSMIEQKLKKRADVVTTTESSDAEFLNALSEICTLNKLRDANGT